MFEDSIKKFLKSMSSVTLTELDIKNTQIQNAQIIEPNGLQWNTHIDLKLFTHLRLIVIHFSYGGNCILNIKQPWKMTAGIT